MQWVAGPKFSRHHDKMSSMSALVSSGGRVFYIFDDAPRVSILLPPDWHLVARDAFNGTTLWKRQITRWQSHLWRLKSGPASLPRRLVSVGDYVYVTLAIDGPVLQLDAATGKTLQEYKGTAGAEEIIISSDKMLVVVKEGQSGDAAQAIRRGQAWDERGWKVMSLDPKTGETLWTKNEAVLPTTLATDSKHVVFHNGESVVCLDFVTGKEKWRSEKIARAEKIQSFYSPTLVLYKDVVLFSGGETAGKQTGGWYRGGKDTMTSVDVETGKVLWAAEHPPSGYRSAEDLLVVDGLVWTGETTSGRAAGLFTGRDPRTGEIKKSFEPDVETYWFHHRCYRAKATNKSLLMSRTGIEFVDTQKEHWDPNHFVRGACLYGVMPANGLVYAPQHPCACYMEAKLVGFNALAPAAASKGPDVANDRRLLKGPAYDSAQQKSGEPSDDDWPTLRQNAERSASMTASIPSDLKQTWKIDIGGDLTSPIVADGKLFVAQKSNHTVHAIDTETGKQLWQFAAGGKVDSPPTWYNGCVYFGSADGYVYCLRASDGAVAWRFLAATADRRTVSFEQVESVWPVHGSVLIRDDALYFVAGRSMFLDGGLRFWKLEPKSGDVLSENKLGEIEKETGKNIQEFVSWLNMPVGLPDVLSSDGDYVYMRSQPFELDGKRLPLKTPPRGENEDAGAPVGLQGKKHAHVFSPSGFLDDSYWHRTYQMYGDFFVGGWQGYYRSGKNAPAGKIVVHDEGNVFGFGRKPKYWRWTTPIEHHLFSIAKSEDTATEDGPLGGTIVMVDKSDSLSIAKTPLSVEAWVKPSRPSGVVVARGGGAMGYSLYIKNGQPTFSIRTGGKVNKVISKGKIVGKWTHLAGVLDGDGKLSLYVNGQPAGQRKGVPLISGDPIEGLAVGGDDKTPAGDYPEGSGLTGLIDEVRVYRRALSAAEVAKHVTDNTASVRNGNGLVLALHFDDGMAKDVSGQKNHGQVVSARSVEGKEGRALQFSGGAARPADFNVKYQWTTDVPLMVRAMLLADDTIFIAGPEDLIDEDNASSRTLDPEVKAALAKQLEIWDGKHGADLWAVSKSDGQAKAKIKLHTPPIFDGMAAAQGKLFIVGMDGSITCWGK